jgi:flagellar hook-basal body complex protein FliE
MDVRNTLAAGAYAQARPQIAATQTAPAAGEVFSAAVQNVATTLQEGETQARAAMTGGADPHSMVMALAQTELAVETAVTIRDRVVEAYQEILRMPV